MRGLRAGLSPQPVDLSPAEPIRVQGLVAHHGHWH